MTLAGPNARWCWPIHPRPLPGELFSSWLLRSARANRVKLTAFTALTLGDKTLLRRDMDRQAGERELGLLARRTVQAREALSTTTLRSLEGSLTHRMPLTSHARWVLPFGLWREGGRVSGIPFCPLCLADGEAYFRLDWRCSFAPACPLHATLLHDACPHCLAPALFHRLEFGKTVKNELVRTPITTCWRCQGDLREAEEAAPASPLTLWTQEKFAQARSAGRVMVGDRAVPATEFADVSYELLGVLSRGSRTAAFRQVVAGAAGVPVLTLPPSSRWRYLESLPVPARAGVLAMLGWLLQDWPARLVGAARASRLSRSRFTWHLDPETVPGWFREALLPLNTGHGRPRGRTQRCTT